MIAALQADKNAPATRQAAYIIGAIFGASLLLLAAIGTQIASAVIAAHGGVAGVDRLLVIAMVLNLAIILFARHRHHTLDRALGALSAADARANQLASRDLLTGCLNRRSLGEDAATMFTDSRTRRKAMAMLMIDLDHFKAVNDVHGHGMGDALLRAVATEIAAALPPGAIVARLGSDEFACGFLFDSVQTEFVERIVERLLARFAQPFVLDTVMLHVAASIGAARSDFDCASGEALLRAADIAMHAAKRSGRGRRVWFDQSMERALQTRSELENGLRHAIPSCEIVPYFEQQVDLATGTLSGFEVLARWEHPTRGVIPPDNFIHIAEESGMIGALSLSIMHQAFTAARDWDASLTLSVNISPAQLRDAWLAQKIIKTLTETGFPAHRLEIEITESSLFDNLALAQSICGSLKNQGIRIALDDFGTGYSSLAHLRALPFDRIKIDKSFVQSINDNVESAAIVNMITRLGESLNLPVTAEGIEDAAIEERLCAIGCAKGQGYLYGRPMPVTRARQLLAEKRLLRFAVVADVADQRLAG